MNARPNRTHAGAAEHGDHERRQLPCHGAAGLPLRKKAAKSRVVKKAIVPELAAEGESTRGRAWRSLPGSNLAAAM
jgi:hypothetical protein